MRATLVWVAAVWLIGLVAVFGWNSFAPRQIWLNWAQAVAGPYDFSDCYAVWIAHARGVAVAVMWMMAAWGWGARLADFLLVRGSGSGVMVMGLGLISLGLAVFGMGVVGLLHPVCLAVLALPAVSAVMAIVRRGRSLALDRGAAAAAAHAPGSGSLAGERLARVVAAAIGMFMLVYLLPTLAPELGWDALTYHLRAPSHYLAAGRIHILPFSLGSFYPFLAEMWFMLGLALGGDSAAKLLNFGFLPLTALALVSIGVALGSLLGGRLAALLYVAMPAAGILAAQSYNDLEVAFLSLLAVWAALHPLRSWRFASAVLCGGAMGCKYTGVWMLLICGLAWVLAASNRRRALLPAVMYGGVALAVFFVWPARAWLWTGNPVYPLLEQVFPGGGWNPYYTAQEAARIVPVSAPQHAGEALWALVRFPFEFSWSLQAIGVLFTPLLMGLLPALWLVRKLPAGTGRSRGAPSDSDGLTGLLLAGAGSAVLWVLLRAGDGRYLLPAAALLAIPAAMGTIRLAACSRAYGWIAGLALVGGLVFQAGHWISYVSKAYVPWRVALGLEARSTYLCRALLPNYEYQPMAQRINQDLPPGARILLFSDIMSYYIDRKVIFDTQQVMPPIGFRLATGCQEPAGLRKRFRQLGLGYVLYSSRLVAFERDCRCLRMPPEAEACYEAFWRRYAELAFEIGGLRMFRLRTERAAAGARPPPFLVWPGIQDVALTVAEEARAAGDWGRAVAALTRLRDRVPDLVEARVRLADLYRLQGRMEEGAKETREAERLGADSGMYWFQQARLRARARDWAGACAAARRSVERWPIPRVWTLLAAYAYNAREFSEARRAAAQAMRLNPYDREVQRVYAAVK